MKSFLLKIFLPAVAIMLSATAVTMAQPGGGGPTPGPGGGAGGGGAATDVPIDGGISLLLAGGVAYGVKHLRARRRKA